MSWRDVLTAIPHSYPQYSHYPQKPPSAGNCGDSVNIGDRVSENNTTSSRAAELREKARLTTTWDGLRGVLEEAQAAFDAGEVTREEAESLAGYAMDRSRQMPDAGEGERLSELLARQPVVRVRSRLLGEVVVWVADAAEVPEDTGEVVYREAELRRMVGRSPAEVRAVHQLKKVFDGEVVESSPDAPVIPSEALYTPGSPVKAAAAMVNDGGIGCRGEKSR